MSPTDSELLDALETEIKREPLLLWDGNGNFPGGPRGLSLLGGEHSLREAIAGLAGFACFRVPADGAGGSPSDTPEAK